MYSRPEPQSRRSCPTASLVYLFPMGSTLPLIERALGFSNRTAIRDDTGSYTYAELVADSESGAAGLLDGAVDLDENRVAFMVEPSYGYVRMQWSIWRAGGIAVPLCLTHPAPELEYVLDTTRPTVAVASPRHARSFGTAGAIAWHRFLAVDDVDGRTDGLARSRARAQGNDPLHERHHRSSQRRGHRPIPTSPPRSNRWSKRGSGATTIGSS